MNIRSRLSRLNQARLGARPPRFFVQRCAADGTCAPPDAEVEAAMAAAEAEGYEPRLIVVRYVNQQPA